MSGLDMNASPTEDDDINMEPQFCTQAALEEIVEESPDPMVEEQEAFGGRSDEYSGRDRQQQGEAHNAGNNSIPTTSVPIESTTYPDMEEGATDGADMHEEVASIPKNHLLGCDLTLLKLQESTTMLTPQSWVSL